MRLATEVFGASFQNPVMLAAGTCGFGQELSSVIDVDALGGFVTKSVTLEPRAGNAAPRLTEFGGGMLNSVGLANPGLAAARRDKLRWIRDNVKRAQVFVSVAGHSLGEFPKLVDGLDSEDGFLGFEINLSCPNNDRNGGPVFALDPEAVRQIVATCRARTERPLLAKLAPADPALAHTVRVATEAGADGLTLVNTLPGHLLAGSTGASRLGAGAGGVSGPALRPAGIHAVRTARAATHVPIVGVGGVVSPVDAVAYARAGASLVQIGTASFANPRAGLDVIDGLGAWGREHAVGAWEELVAAAQAEASSARG